MQLSIDIDGAGSVDEATQMQGWLRQGRIKDVQNVAQQEAPPKPGEQGPTLLAIITVVLGSKALVELVRSIHRYIEARTPKTKITITSGKKKIVIDATNPPPLAELVEQAKVLADG
jgi:hypothetical protein